MIHTVLDLSQVESGRHLLSDARLTRRLKEKLNDAITSMLSQRGVTDLANQGSVTVKVRLDEPSFNYDRTEGFQTTVIPGNPRFNVNDTIPKDTSGAMSGKGGSGKGQRESEDGFVFEFPANKVEEWLFEELKLPNLAKKEFSRESEVVLERAGHRSEGPPALLDIGRSSARAMGRRKALKRPDLRRLEQLEDQIDELERAEETPEKAKILAQLRDELIALKRRRNAVPYFDKGDLRYRHSQFVEQPITQAVVFCLLDVSGSMDEHHKKLAKLFFWLFRRFIAYQYQSVDLVFIRHTDVAQEITEQQFFFDKKSGGTVVSSALEKMLEIIDHRYPSHLWNFYACQASDGGVTSHDALTSAILILDQILPKFQYYAYIECLDAGSKGNTRSSRTELWAAFQEIQSAKFQIRQVSDPSEIYPVLANMFKGSDQKKKIKKTA